MSAAGTLRQVVRCSAMSEVGSGPEVTGTRSNGAFDPERTSSGAEQLDVRQKRLDFADEPRPRPLAWYRNVVF
jgi:hypothetical protein